MYMSTKLNIKKYKKKSKKNKGIKIMYGGLNCNTNNKAYMMLGHAGPTNEILDVPDNCVYITKTICGTISFGELFDNLRYLFFNNRELVKNPCDINNFNELNRIVSEESKVHKYIGNIIDNRSGKNAGENANFLNMHISKKTCDTSAMCAKSYLFKYKNVNYQSCAFWFYKDNEKLREPLSSVKEKYNRIDIRYSGLMTADNSFEVDRQVIVYSLGTPWKYPMLTTENITNIYRYSVYPKTEDILQKIKELNIDITSYLKITDPTDANYFDPLHPPADIDFDDGEWHENSESYHAIISGYDFVKLILDNYTITQSKLFEMFPGVHYNTLCRSFYTPRGLYETFTFSKKLQRQMSVDNRQNLLDIFKEENENGSREIVEKIEQSEEDRKNEEQKNKERKKEQEIAQREEDRENEEREIAQREEEELLQREGISSVGEPPIYNFPQFEPLYKLGKWFGRGGKNKKTRRRKRNKNKTRRNKRCKNKNV